MDNVFCGWMHHNFAYIHSTSNPYLANYIANLAKYLVPQTNVNKLVFRLSLLLKSYCLTKLIAGMESTLKSTCAGK